VQLFIQTMKTFKTIQLTLIAATYLKHNTTHYTFHTVLGEKKRLVLHQHQLVYLLKTANCYC